MCSIFRTTSDISIEIKKIEKKKEEKNSNGFITRTGTYVSTDTGTSSDSNGDINVSSGSGSENSSPSLGNKLVKHLIASSSFESKKCTKCQWYYNKDQPRKQSLTSSGEKVLCKCLKKEFTDTITHEEKFTSFPCSGKGSSEGSPFFRRDEKLFQRGRSSTVTM